MRRRERLIIIIATAGLAITAIGALLPWATIGGRSRSGFGTADTFIGLADGALPDQIAWIGRWWYAPAFLVLLAWATVFIAGRRIVRAAGTATAGAALVLWWLFVWAAGNWNVFNVNFLGPVVASAGLVTVGACCSRRRPSLLSEARVLGRRGVR